MSGLTGPLSWPGAGDHEGHTVSVVDQWPPRIENATVFLSKPMEIRGGLLTCGWVRCSCGGEWAVSGWPAADPEASS